MVGCEETDELNPNHAPVIIQASAVCGGVPLGETGTLMCLATDEDEDSLTYLWTVSAGVLTGSGSQVSWIPPDRAALYPFEVRVEDGHGAYAKASFDVQVFGLGHQTFQLLNSDNSDISSDYLHSVAMALDGSIWTGDNFGNLGHLANGDWNVWSIPGSELISLAVDSQSIVWVGAGGGGLQSFNGSTATAYDTFGTISPAIAIDSQDQVWVGTPQGLYFLDEGELMAYDSTGTWQSDISISSLALDGSENVWAIGKVSPSTTNKLLHFSQRQYTSTALSRAPTYRGAITSDHLGNIWIAHEFGVSRFDGTTLNYFDAPDSSLNNLGGLIADGQGNLWVGANGGMYQFDGNSWDIIRGTNSELSNSRVSDIAIDDSGNKWLSLYRISGDGGGLAVYNENGIH